MILSIELCLDKVKIPILVDVRVEITAFSNHHLKGLSTSLDMIIQRATELNPDKLV